MSQRTFRCGYATLIGQPNVGKSTLLNRLVGEKLAIVSPKPQTTRDQIRGIWTGADSQVIFLDTPGVHQARSPLNRAMVGQAIEALESVDVVILVIDGQEAAKWLERMGKRGSNQATGAELPTLAPPPMEPDELEIGDRLEGKGDDKKVSIDDRIAPGDRRVIRQILRYSHRYLIAINKIDRMAPRKILPIIAAYANAPQVGPIVPISARTGDGIQALREAIRPWLPERAAEFEADELTDRSLRFLSAELLREQVFLQTRDEVPYGVACEIELWEELPDLTHVKAIVHVEKQAQRGILVGKGGQTMKALASAAREGMEQLTGRKVFLEVHVRVEPQWSERMEMLKQFGYVL